MRIIFSCLATAALSAAASAQHDAAGPMAKSQLYFTGPAGMHVQLPTQDLHRFDSEPLDAPGRYNFPQGAGYRLKLTRIPGYPGVELYPTVEVARHTPRTAAYLAHSAVSIELTDEDFRQALSGNVVTKVIYVPDAGRGDFPGGTTQTLISTYLEPDADPITEADREGTLLAVVRLGNKQLELAEPN